jgi:hypothetical protein
MTKLLHPLPQSHAILARATASLEAQYLAISSIDTNKYPDLLKSREDTLRYLDFEFEAINADIDFINRQVTQAFNFKTGGQEIAYPYYITALEKCIELLIHMEHWAIWHKLKMDLRRIEGNKKKNAANDAVYIKEIQILEAALGRKLVGTDYPKWKAQLLKNNPKQKVSKKPRKNPKDGTPINPNPNAPDDQVNDQWKDPTLRKKFKELTGCDPTTKKVHNLSHDSTTH